MVGAVMEYQLPTVMIERIFNGVKRLAAKRARIVRCRPPVVVTSSGSVWPWSGNRRRNGPGLKTELSSSSSETEPNFVARFLSAPAHFALEHTAKEHYF